MDRQFGLAAQALRLGEARLAVLASNIANAATPNYKARDLDFRSALAAAGSQPGASINASLRFRQPMQPSLDGNTVEMATEQTAYAEAALHYRASLGFLTARIQTLSQALKGE